MDELPAVLWSYRTTTRSSTGEMPFSLTYGMDAVLPLEIVAGSLRTESFEETANEEGRHQDVDMLNEKREAEQMRQALYKSRTKNYYNRQVRVKNFKVGKWMLRKNESSNAEPLGKLSVNWEGPYKIVESHKNGAYVLEALDGRAIP
ncbi:hypothetical protein Lser_V15G00846 [Lactuca serriola]